MKTVHFCFATHNHQPLGNFDHVIEEAYERSYLPFFQLAERYPVRFATHITGVLLHWLQANHPEHIERLRSMVERGQIEIISGGFYEPILSVIPPRDQQAQIEMLSNAVRSLLGYVPTGMWLAERVWEQPLASVLHRAGMRYVLLDDTHFLNAGLSEQDLTGYYLTEDRGAPLAVIPIAKSLRYTIPFQPVAETIRVLRDAASEDGTNIVCFADDGEKFGVWPQTYEHVYGEGWLEELFAALTEQASWIRMVHPSEALKAVPPKGRIYLPSASYAEMSQWALPTAAENQRYEDFLHELKLQPSTWDAFLPFVRGGYWRNFLVKYPEINQLHKRMLRTSARVESLERAGRAVTEAHQELLSAQCNDPYWHGVFGGAYLPNLRHANFSALVHADTLLDAAEHFTGIRCEAVDYDCDGFEEAIIETPLLALYVKPSLGGAIVEIDFKPCHFHATNTFTRQPEAYHAKIASAAALPRPPDEVSHEGGPPAAADTSAASGHAPAGNGKDGPVSRSIHDLVQTKEAHLETKLFYDWYRRGSMIEHFLAPGVTAEEMKSMTFVELGDFVTSPFEWSFIHGDGILRLARHGTVRGEDGAEMPLLLEKRVAISSTESSIGVTYRLTNESTGPLRLRFASEWAFNLLAGAAHDRYYQSNGRTLSEPHLNSSGSIAASDIHLVDEYLGLRIAVMAAAPAEILRFPIESISLSEAGFERIFQGSVVMPVWNAEIPVAGAWSATLTVTFKEL